MKELSAVMVHRGKSIKESFKQETLNKTGCIIVVDDKDKVIGIVTEGDFRRAIWGGTVLENPIHTIMNSDFVFLAEGHSHEHIKDIFSNSNVQQIPIIKNDKLIGLILRDEFEPSEEKISKKRLSLPVVIMAGGKGLRLDPFTRILPKPLIPIGDKPIIEIIMDRFAEYGISEFYISLNHKEKMIRAFLDDFHNKWNVSYIKEELFLGTAGALKSLEKELKGTFIVSNCDIIVDTDYSRLYEFHHQGKYSLTLVGSMQHHIIPYGVCKLKDGGELEKIDEKPRFDFLANTGLYILNQDIISFIPQNKKFHMTDLIKIVKDSGKKIGVYPVSSESWLDIGQWEEYKKVIEKFK